MSKRRGFKTPIEVQAAQALERSTRSVRNKEENRCKLCAEGMPLKKYFDGTIRHFDGLMAWHRCEAQNAQV